MRSYNKPKQLSLYIIYSLLSVAILNLILINSVFAENLDYSVTVQPTLNVTTSSNNVSLRLNPATNPFDSQNLTVSVGTNNQTGYKLIVSTPNDITNLVEQNDSNLYIETLSAEVSESNFTPNRWGYKLNSSSTNYTPFESGILVNSSDGPTEELVSTTMTFGAKADYDTKAGTYNLALNFQATANPMAPFIQEYDNATCATEASSQSVTVIDERDNNDYQVRYINGNCWMVQNLRYVGDTGSTSSSMIMKADTSNVSADQNLTIGDLTAGNSNDAARIHNSNNAVNGVWYNYAAASAGTVVGTSSNPNANYDICPKGWRLPSYSEQSGIPTTYKSDFFNGGSMVTGGVYDSGSPINTSYGYWWTATSSNSGTGRHIIRFDNSAVGYGDRFLGLYVRCIRSTYMQDVTSSMVADMNNGDKLTLTDARDNKSYTAAKINGQLWMTQNLRYLGDTGSNNSSMTIKSATSNVSSDTTLAYTDLTATPYNDYDNAKIHDSGNTTNGVWYNYAAATAGTITGSSNENVQQYDLCPKGWRLPTQAEFNNITSYTSAFFNGGSSVTGGYYRNGSITYQGDGDWWSTTPNGNVYRWNLYTRNNNLYTSNAADRYYGMYVRCIHN